MAHQEISVAAHIDGQEAERRGEEQSRERVGREEQSRRRGAIP